MKSEALVVSVMMVLLLTNSMLAGPPLPSTNIEGNSGLGVTSTAYLANPAEKEQVLGKPSVSVFTLFAREKDLQSFTITENILGRYEIGYAYERFGLGDWPDDVKTAAGASVSQHLGLHNFNLRAMVVEEGSLDCSWLPAITLGTHFKWNEGQTKLDDDLGGLLDTLGSDHSRGIEFTAVASKTIKDLFARTIILSAGVRNSDAIHTGLFGFAGERRTTFEGSIVTFLTDQLLFCAEYRQKPDLMKQFSTGGRHLVKAENDWWTLCLGYILNDNTTISAGYANLGNVANHREDSAWCFRLKYEF
jgi:hypothetical protein